MKLIPILRVVCSFGLIASAFASVPAQSINQMTNSSGYLGDPTAIWVPEANVYLGARTDGTLAGSTRNTPSVGPTLWRSSRIETLFINPDTHFITVAGQGTTFEAPGLVEWGSALYMSFRTQGVSGDNHQVLTNPYPGDPYCETHSKPCWKLMPDNTDSSKWLAGRDWSYIVRNGKLWCFFSAIGTYHSGIFVQLMQDPKTPMAGHAAVQISSAINPNDIGQPGYDPAQSRPWEFRHNEQSGTNEAPQAFMHTDTTGVVATFVTYSANSYLFGDYLLGLLSFNGSPTDDLDVAAKWTKSQAPFFQAKGYNYGDPAGTVYWVCNTGSNAIVANQGNTADLWMIYNGKFNCTVTSYVNNPATQDSSNFNTVLTSVNNRTIRAQKMLFSSGLPVVMQPWIDGGLHDLPNNEPDTPAYDFLTPASPNAPSLFDDAQGMLDINGNQAPADLQQNMIFYSDHFASSSNNPDGSTVTSTTVGTATFTQTLTSSLTAGSYFVVPFTGARVQLFGPTGTCTGSVCQDVQTTGTYTASTYGSADVYVDGNMSTPYHVTLGTTLSGPFFDTKTVGLSLPYGSHTLTIIVTGTPDATYGDVPPVALDYVKVFNNAT